MKSKKQNNMDNGMIHIHESKSEVTQLQKREKKHHKKISFIFILVLIWIGLFFGSLFFIVSSDQFHFSMAREMQYVTYNINNFYNFVVGNGAADGMDARFYQYLVVAVTGAALAACGAVFQGSFRNVMAGPSTMGVMSGGTLGCTVYVVFFVSTVESGTVVQKSADTIQAYLSRNLWQQYTNEFFVLIGCFAAVLLVLGVALAAGKGKVSAHAMILAGTVFSTITANITMIVQYYMILKDPEDERIDTIRDMMMGNFDGTGSPEILAMMGIPIIICLVILILISGKLNVLTFGEDEAMAMGLNVRRYRTIMIILGTVLTAVVVAFCGHVGFLGFMVPLIARKISGPDMRRLLPTSILTGAILLTVIFDIAYFLGMTDSMNVITSAIGCILMVVVLMRKGGGKDAVKQGPGAPNMGIR